MNHERIEKKIFANAGDEFSRLLAYWRFRSFRIVFTNGCFDVLHRGHAEYLARAASMGDVLVVGLNTDDSVRRLKGPSRPVNTQANRAYLLASMGFVSAIVLFDEDTPENLIQIVRPSFLVKGADYNDKTIVGADIVTSYGGNVITIDLVQGLSTSETLRKIKGQD